MLLPSFLLLWWGLLGLVGKEPLGGGDGVGWGEGCCFCWHCFCFEFASSSPLASALGGKAKRTCLFSFLLRFSSSFFLGFHISACSGVQ